MVTSPASVDVDVVYEPLVTFTFVTGFFFGAVFFATGFCFGACFFGAAFLVAAFLAGFFSTGFFFGVVFFGAMTVDISRDCRDRGGSSLAARVVWATL